MVNPMTGIDNVPVRMLFARHGESEGNVNPSMYVKKGDSNVGLTERGWTQAYHLGQFLKSYYTATDTAEWPMVFLSPYQRTQETLAGIHFGMEGTFLGEPAKLYEDPRLVEKFFGAASAMAFPPEGCDARVIETLRLLSDAVYKGDRLSAANLFGESTKSTQGFVKSFIDGTLYRDIQSGKRDFLFVTHGAVIQAFIANWVHAQMRHKDLIGNPNNCDVIEITGTPKNWAVTKIYDGKKMKPANRNMVEGIRRMTVTDLPPVPDFIRALKGPA